MNLKFFSECACKTHCESSKIIWIFMSDVDAATDSQIIKHDPMPQIICFWAALGGTGIEKLLSLIK